MAKETKAERTLREATESMERQVQAASTYLTRMLALVERAQKANFELEVKNSTFVLRDRDEDERDVRLCTLYPEYTTWNDDQLASCEWDLTYKEEATKESNRKFLATQVALAKLSKEEKELLGL